MSSYELHIIISRWVILRMRSVSDIHVFVEKQRENIKTHFVISNVFPRKSGLL
jgi:hypothetical protein